MTTLSHRKPGCRFALEFGIKLTLQTEYTKHPTPVLVHEAAFRHGTVVTYALKKQWHEFAAEIARHANLLNQSKDHKSDAESILEYCNKL